jgi:hypothetical protein
VLRTVHAKIVELEMMLQSEIIDPLQVAPVPVEADADAHEDAKICLRSLKELDVPTKLACPYIHVHRECRHRTVRIKKL